MTQAESLLALIADLNAQIRALQDENETLRAVETTRPNRKDGVAT